jgi:ATP-dependent DNA ligase
MEQLILELRNTTKRNEKIEILKKSFTRNINIALLIARCYNPFEMFNVSKIKSSIVGIENLSDNYEEFNKILDILSSREFTGNSAKNILITFLNKLTKESQEIVISIINKDIKAGVGIETINSAYPELIEQFNVQLANKYKIDKNYKTDFWYGSPKFDGIRCIYLDKYNGKLLSREGHTFIGFDNILNDVQQLVDRIKKLNISDINNEIYIDGELFSDDLDFNTIQGIVMSNKNINEKDKSKIYYKVFAISSKNTEDMVKLFQNSSIFEGLNYIKPINYFKIENNSDIIMDKTRELVNQGYEGLMLRSPKIVYEWKRSDALLKSKLLNETEAELIVTGYEFGKSGTKYENMIGSLILEGTVINPTFTDGKVKEGIFNVKCNVGTGFSDIERAEIFKNIQEYIGKEIVINYQCMCQNQNQNDNEYSLRFTVKKYFKLDR